MPPLAEPRDSGQQRGAVALLQLAGISGSVNNWRLLKDANISYHENLDGSSESANS